jgi:hypothetical protein
MAAGVQMMLWIAGVHIIGLVCVAVLMFPALKDNSIGPDHPDGEGGDGWGRGPKLPPSKPKPPRGGIPLPDAVPSRVRLREPGRLSDRVGRHERRPAREPQRRPVRAPHGSGWDSGTISGPRRQ